MPVSTPKIDRVVECYDTPMPDSPQSNFTNDDRKALYEQGAQLALLMRDFHDLRREIRDNDSPTQREFGLVAGKVEALQNFRWYLMGIALGAGIFGHLVLSKIGL